MEKEKIDKILNGEILIDNIEDLIYMYNNYFEPDLLYHCNDVIRDNMEVAKFLCNTDLCFYLDISERLKESRELLLYILNNLGFYHLYSNSSRDFCCILEVAKEKFRKDKEIVRLAIEKDEFNYELVDDDQREIYYVDKTLLEDKNFAIELVQIQPYVLKHLSENLKKDKDVVLASVKHNGLTLKDASEKLKKDKDVVLEAVKQNSSALQYASEELQNDIDFIIFLVSKNIEVFISDEMYDEIHNIYGNKYDEYEDMFRVFYSNIELSD